MFNRKKIKRLNSLILYQNTVIEYYKNEIIKLGSIPIPPMPQDRDESYN